MQRTLSSLYSYSVFFVLSSFDVELDYCHSFCGRPFNLSFHVVWDFFLSITFPYDQISNLLIHNLVQLFFCHAILFMLFCLGFKFLFGIWKFKRICLFSVTYHQETISATQIYKTEPPMIYHNSIFVLEVLKVYYLLIYFWR